MKLPSFAPARVETATRADGALVLRSPLALGDYARCVGDWLEAWATRAPDRVFLAERTKAGLRRVTYAEARSSVRAIGQGLLDRGARADAPVMILGDNSVDHALVALAAMHVGVAAAPVSPAYSLQSKDFAKLRDVAAALRPSILVVPELAPFAPALDALARTLGEAMPPIVTSEGDGAAAPARHRARAVAFEDLRRTDPRAVVDEAFAAIGPETVAKILFTSGSTGAPKGVVNPHRMLTSNQQAIVRLWPFLEERPPVVVDWLPWSHTFGGNHNFDMVLRNGGTLHVDVGRPVPGRIEASIAYLREVSPTLYFNVPRGFDAILPFLEEDRAFAEHFFAELDLVFYAAAALPQSSWDRLDRVARSVREGGVPFVSAWGSTETAPLATSVHFPIPRAGVIGLPAPGTTIALVPVEDKLEIRVRGPNVTPGAWTAEGLVPVELDAEGFLPTGDAVRLEDPAHPEKGIVFDGRLAENFKLTNGTWVCVGELRVKLVAACAPLVADAVITGHDRDEVGALLFLSPAAVRLEAADLRGRLLDALRAYDAAFPAASTRIARALVATEALSIDRGEITDKGYVNQRAVRTHRAALVTRLHGDGALAPHDDVLVP